jgi:hypothetical protein
MQRNVGPKISRRGRSNVILVAEMRDLETFETALVGLKMDTRHAKHVRFLHSPRRPPIIQI